MLGPNFTEGYKELVVGGPCIEEEGTNDALDSSDACGIKGLLDIA